MFSLPDFIYINIASAYGAMTDRTEVETTFSASLSIQVGYEQSQN